MDRVHHPQTTVQINLKDTVLDERSESQRITYYTIPCTEHCQKAKTMGMENRSIAGKDCRGDDYQGVACNKEGLFKIMELFPI